MDIDKILSTIPKIRDINQKRSPLTIKYGMFGLSLGQDTYTRLYVYCEKNNIHKSKLVKALVIKYLDEMEGKWV